MATRMGSPGHREPLIGGILANLPLLRNTAPAHIAELARSARMQSVRRGETVCRRGEAQEGFYAVAYGLVKLVLRGSGGREKVLRLVGPGQSFGEALVFAERPNPLEAVALADTMVVLLPSKAVIALSARDPQFAHNLLVGMSERMHAFVADIEASTLHSGRQRIAAYLESLVDGDPAKSVRLPATKTVLASQLGLTKETLSRLLHEFSAQGLIRIARREIDLLDRPRLSAIAHGAAA